ncbi:MAG: hypothetical protein AVDCRST_MAG88-551, partial [uncultured Thermomicrobiales bacterium]
GAVESLRRAGARRTAWRRPAGVSTDDADVGATGRLRAAMVGLGVAQAVARVAAALGLAGSPRPGRSRLRRAAAGGRRRRV